MGASRQPAHGPDHAAHAHGNAHGDALGYMRGLLWSLVLTILPFMLVMGGWLPRAVTIPLILAIGVAQMAVHLVYFLHLRSEPGERWNVVAFVFTAIVVGILVVGSLWIMHNMDSNMMGM
ncbi:cytochrome o ubiquinol oxidase subunit IV [Roseomonas sp. GC11]|uniref:cytochrome o ubiquinol oxidase subunit IV n=1 Tax=Roseomonas sp. GC11 TaxID=2950546 RepID=UPI00210C4DCF|nr:cytochrome o ubiquinol oxidase subunit IV [Roseomonas sp. GC11]MCQ4159497.1 cytochrome o ubiquinol oxidase subunit IV [Roseomonas sp. GC11]